jgi:hypothetical protein
MDGKQGFKGARKPTIKQESMFADWADIGNYFVVINR